MTERKKNDWVKGMKSPNPAGRPKGSRNRYTQKMLDTAMTHLVSKDFNPMDNLLELYNTTEDENLKHRILSDMLKFNNNPTYIEQDVDGKALTQEVTREDLLKAIKEELSPEEE